MNKRIIAVILGLIMLSGLLFAFIPAAQAQGDVTLSLSATPKELEAAGSVKITAVVTNNGKADLISDVAIHQGSTKVADLGNISNNANSSGEFSIDVTEAMLGKPISFSVTYTDDGGETGSSSASITIAKKARNPKIEIKTTVSNNTVSNGEKVKFTYTVHNVGDVELTNIVISDTNIKSGNIGTIAKLAPGAKQSAEHTVTVTKEITSKAAVSAKYGSQNVSASAASVSVKIANAALEASISADKTSGVVKGDTVKIKLNLSNKGNVRLDKMDIKLDDGTSIREKTYLVAGKSVTIEQDTVINENRSVFITIECYDPSGKQLSIKTNEISYEIEEEIEELPVGVNPVEITATPASTQLAEVGSEASFAIQIKNNTASSLFNLVITDNTGKNVQNYGELAAAGTAEFTVKYQVNSSASFAFTVSATDELGNTYSDNTEAVEITVPEATPTPEASILPEETAASGGMGGLSTLVVIMIIIVVLIVVAAVVLVILIVQEKKAKKAAALKASSKYGKKSPPSGPRNGDRRPPTRPSGPSGGSAGPVGMGGFDTASPPSGDIDGAAGAAGMGQGQPPRASTRPRRPVSHQQVTDTSVPKAERPAAPPRQRPPRGGAGKTPSRMSGQIPDDFEDF
jgi:hypothetical protein